MPAGPGAEYPDGRVENWVGGPILFTVWCFTTEWSSRGGSALCGARILERARGSGILDLAVELVVPCGERVVGGG